METQNLTLKIQTIASTYLSLSRIMQKEQTSLFSTHPFNIYSQFCASVELAFLSLPAPLKRIINNDFFYQDYPGWWKLSYNKRKYLRLRELAIKKFLEAYDEIH